MAVSIHVDLLYRMSLEYNMFRSRDKKEWIPNLQSPVGCVLL